MNVDVLNLIVLHALDICYIYSPGAYVQMVAVAYDRNRDEFDSFTFLFDITKGM